MYSYGSVYIDIGEFYRAQEFVIDAKLNCNYPTGRKCYGLIYCIDGDAEFRFSNGNKSRLQKGEAILISPEIAYVVTTKSGCHHYTVNFDINRAYSDENFLNGCFRTFSSDAGQMVLQLFKKLVKT